MTDKNFECPNCGNILNANEKECKYCGSSNPQYSNSKLPFNFSLSNNSNTQGNGTVYSTKSKVVCGVLQLILGGLGIGRFYSGHISIGIAQLLLSIFGCGIGAVWAFIDGIIILCSSEFKDAEGKIMK